MKTISFAALILLGMFSTTAFAAAAIAPADGNLLDYAKPIFDAVMHGQWWLAASLGVVFACAGARKFMPDSWKDGVKGDIVGTATAFGMAFGGALATWAVAPGAVLTLAVLLTAGKVGVVAIGGYTVIHKAAVWIASSAWFLTKAPAWLKSVVSLVLAMIGSNAIAKAEKAGRDAVGAAPGRGLAGDAAVREVP